MVCVFPGCADILAIDFRFHNVFSSEDFPTLDRPQNAISILSCCGSLLVTPHTVSSSNDLITTFYPSTSAVFSTS